MNENILKQLEKLSTQTVTTTAKTNKGNIDAVSQLIREGVLSATKKHPEITEKLTFYLEKIKIWSLHIRTKEVLEIPGDLYWFYEFELEKYNLK